MTGVTFRKSSFQYCASIDMFGYWTDVNRNLQKAIELNSVIFAHRRGYDNKNNLQYEN